MILHTAWNTIILIIFIANLLFPNGEAMKTGKCDERVVNMHMVECYQKHIDPTIDSTWSDHGYFMDGNILCQAYNESLSYRECLFEIFDLNGICSLAKYPYTYEFGKIFWKLILSSCVAQENQLNKNCSPSPLSRRIIDRCHYSFDDSFPTKCKKFLNSLKCLERYENELVPERFQSKCSRDKAYYYYYGDVAMRLQLAINICEMDSSSSSSTDFNQ